MNTELITLTGPGLTETLLLSQFWLRDHCRCPECYSFETHQRKFNVLDIPLDITSSQTKWLSDKELEVTCKFKYAFRLCVIYLCNYFLTTKKTGSDGHISKYQLDTLCAQQNGARKQEIISRNSIRLWNKNLIESAHYARVSLTDYLCNVDVTRSVVASLVKYGLAFIEKVPPNVQSTEMAVKQLFSVQKTLFGEMWSFNDNKDHSDSAYSKERLGAHTDNTYFNDAAGLQVLHCIHHSGSGGENLLVDGFKVLEELRENQKSSYERLCQINVPAEYVEEGKHHTHSAPLIRLSTITGLPEQIRYKL